MTDERDARPPGPNRVQLSRAKGWRMPPNTVKVDRTTKWGNPFVVGRDGTRSECVELFEKLMAGYICLTKGRPAWSREYLQMAARDRAELVGKNLACWCPLNAPCHGDVLLRVAAMAAVDSSQRHRSGERRLRRVHCTDGL